MACLGIVKPGGAHPSPGLTTADVLQLGGSPCRHVALQIVTTIDLTHRFAVLQIVIKNTAEFGMFSGIEINTSLSVGVFFSLIGIFPKRDTCTYILSNLRLLGMNSKKLGCVEVGDPSLCMDW